MRNRSKGPNRNIRLIFPSARQLSLKEAARPPQNTDQMVNLVRFMLVVFLVVPNGLAFTMWKLSEQESAKAELVLDGPVQFLSERPFVAEGVLISKSEQTLISRYFQDPCLAYHIKVDMLQTVTDSDGELEDRRTHVFEERKQVPDLMVKFPTGEGLLDIELLETFYKSKYEEIGHLPDDINSSETPNTKGSKPWYEVHEHIFIEGQNVTVAGGLNQRGLLEPHSGIQELIVFPGDTAECAAVLKQSSGSYKFIAYGLIAMSVFGTLMMLIILKFMKK